MKKNNENVGAASKQVPTDPPNNTQGVLQMISDTIIYNAFYRCYDVGIQGGGL